MPCIMYGKVSTATLVKQLVKFTLPYPTLPYLTITRIFSSFLTIFIDLLIVTGETLPSIQYRTTLLLVARYVTLQVHDIREKNLLFSNRIESFLNGNPIKNCL